MNNIHRTLLIALGALCAQQAAGLFLGKSDQLPGVGTALLLDQGESSAVREQFYTKVTGKSASQVKAAWSRLVFSGKATPPKEIASSAEVKQLVASNPNAVGYIEKSAVDATVKVLLAVD
jgi:ABC-type phosphate transport system substrate-binding protein